VVIVEAESTIAQRITPDRQQIGAVAVRHHQAILERSPPQQTLLLSGRTTIARQGQGQRDGFEGDLRGGLERGCPGAWLHLRGQCGTGGKTEEPEQITAVHGWSPTRRQGNGDRPPQLAQ
jgi:hypothetical protein